MIKLIKQDLESFLCLIGDRRPALSRGDLLRDRKRLALREAADYLFLARGDRSYLFPLEEVYTPGMYFSEAAAVSVLLSFGENM